VDITHCSLNNVFTENPRFLEWETEEISYVVLLKDWESSPSQLKIQDRSLGAGQFGIVKQGFYTPEKGDPETVAVKMLKGTERMKEE
jgi:hypothetical protein